jgi:alkyl hydroperoxide reductase subunit AhpC
MSIRIGQQVPDLRLDAYVAGVDEPVPVRVGHEGAWTAVVFYPRDFTFVCPTELAAFGALEAAFREEDTVVLAASTDSWWVHRAWLRSEPLLGEVAYPVIADTGHELARAFDVLLDDGACLRATFVIDPSGTVRHSSVTDLNVGRSAEETLRVVQALRTGELCPAGWRPGQATLMAA